MELDGSALEADLMEFYASSDYQDAMAVLAADADRPQVQADARDVDIGMNVTWYGGQDRVDAAPFINQVKGATGWLVPGQPDARPDFDADGYVTALPDGKPVISAILNRDPMLSGIEPYSGTFRLYGQGDGTIYLSQSSHGDLANGVATASLATEVIGGESYWYKDFDYDPGDRDRVILKIAAMNAADHIRDIALVHESHLAAHRAGEIFNPDMVADLAPYETLRFLNWMKANQYEKAADGAALDPEQRYLTPDHYNYNTRYGDGGQYERENYFISSAPFEHIIALANATDSDPWVNLPVDIPDARVAWMADYAAANLEDGLEIVWEYGNELWSTARGFQGSQYAQYMAEKTFGIEDWSGVVEWDAYRGPQIFDIIEQRSPEAADKSRYVATVWGFHTPTKDGVDLPYAYAQKYFQAVEAQKMADAPSRPQDIITDYSHGLYFGGTFTEGRRDDAVSEYIIEAYGDDTARAEALTRWLLFGADPAHRVDLDTGDLGNPVRDIAYRPGLAISVLDLVLADMEAGLDPLRELETVLQLQGDTLLYRGVNAAAWTPVLTFQTDPDKTLAEMIHDVEIVGYGTKLGGEWRTGLYSGLAQQAELTLAGHKAFVEQLGLTWSGYEGGPHLYQPPTGGQGMFQAFGNDGWANLVQDVWFDMLDAYGVDEYVHFMAYSRFVDGNDWGAQRYIGQDLSEAPKAAYLVDTIEFTDAATPPATTAPPPDSDQGLAPAVPFDVPRWHTPATDWAAAGPDAWSSSGTGKVLLETAATLTAGQSYSLEMTLAAAAGATVPAGLTVSVFALGGGAGAQQIAEQSVTVADGRLVIDLDALPGDRDQLRVVLNRTDAASGELTVSGLSLRDTVAAPGPTDPVPAPVPQPAPAQQPLHVGGSDMPRGWQQTAGGGVSTTPSWDKMILETDRVLTGGDAYRLDFDLGAIDPAAALGSLRVTVFAAGGGTELLSRQTLDLSQVGPVSLDLGLLPPGREMFRISLQRLDGTGEVALSNLGIGLQTADPAAVA